MQRLYGALSLVGGVAGRGGARSDDAPGTPIDVHTRLCRMPRLA